jgi:hypothetical protein
MAETEKANRYLRELDLNRLTTEAALAAIRELADGTLSQMSSEYYVQRLEAVGMLARIAADRLRPKQA